MPPSGSAARYSSGNLSSTISGGKVRLCERPCAANPATGASEGVGRGQVLGADDADHEFLLLDRRDEEQAHADEKGVHEDGEAEDEEQRAAIAELVADFAGGNEADNRPAHAEGSTKGALRRWGVIAPLAGNGRSGNFPDFALSERSFGTGGNLLASPGDRIPPEAQSPIADISPPRAFSPARDPVPDPEGTPPMMTRAFAAPSAEGALAPFSLTRRDPLPSDVEIDILYCGVCHSDLHQARDEWHESHRPSTRACPATRSSAASTQVGPGREEVQARATSPRSGAWSIRAAPARTARSGLEQYCDHFPTLHLQLARQALRRRHLGGYSDTHRRGRGVHAEGVREGRTSPRPPRCCAPGSRRTRRCGTGRSARARRSASSASAGSGTWA